MDERIIKETGKLGFGLMRLPHKGRADVKDGGYVFGGRRDVF